MQLAKSQAIRLKVMGRPKTWLVGLAIGIAACSPTTREPETPPKVVSSTAEVISAARRYAREQGVNEHDYEASATLEQGRWFVHFAPPKNRAAAPGDFFTVVIDDKGLDVPRLVPGK